MLNPKDDSGWLTTAEVAKILVYKDQTLRTWRCHGKYPAGIICKNIGSKLRWYIDKSMLPPNEAAIDHEGHITDNPPDS